MLDQLDHEAINRFQDDGNPITKEIEFFPKLEIDCKESISEFQSMLNLMENFDFIKKGE